MVRRWFNLGLSARIIRGDAPYAPAHYKGGNKPGFGIKGRSHLIWDALCRILEP
ncbi:MAG: hypothetical protein HC941_23345 [Microcoleus sp. SU_5_3]|nr:hypothetical protein [Microcoleus sp. SU_5_3]